MMWLAGAQNQSGGFYVTDSGHGTTTIATAVDLFYDKLLAEPTLAYYWESIDLRRLKAHQRAFLLAALGGPEVYSGREMQVAHESLDITDDEFDLVVLRLTESLDEAGVGADVVARVARLIAPLRARLVKISSN